MIYQKSTNYELLYDLVMQGNEMPCYMIDEFKLRQIIRIKKGENNTIFIDDLIVENLEKGSFVAYCLDNYVEWLLPVNAEFHNNRGELEYQIMVHSVPEKRSLIYYVIVYSLGNDIRFILDTEGDIVPESKYNEFASALEKHDIVYYNTIEQALAVGLEMVKKLRNHV